MLEGGPPRLRRHTRPVTTVHLLSRSVTNAGPIVVDDPTKVLVRRIIAYGIDLVVTLALTAALGSGIFMAMSVEGTTNTTTSGSKITSDSPAIRGCDANQTIVEKVFKNPGHRRLGDLGTHSFVVKWSAAGHPIQVPGVD